uniref:Uncharacterized protein n=1 Tax=Gallus gallus TaxID=9031 RepID=A0A8V0Y345_CHICK
MPVPAWGRRCSSCSASWRWPRQLPCPSPAVLSVSLQALVRKKLPSYRCPVMSLGRHAVLAITARSNEDIARVGQHLRRCITYICSLAEMQEHDSFDAPLHEQMLQSLDRVLQVRLCLSPGFANVEIILQALLPCTKSNRVRVRRCAVERIVSLRNLMGPAFLMGSSSQNSESMADIRLLKEMPDTLMGQLLGHLILCCAEEDEDIRCESTETVQAIHSILAARLGYKFGSANPNLYVEDGHWGHFCAPYAAWNTLLVGSWLRPTERGNFILTVLEGMIQPRVSDTKVVASALDAVLREEGSQLSNVPEIVQSICDNLTSDSNALLRDIMIKTLLKITRLDPQRVVRTMLRDISWCNTSLTVMWQAIVSESSLAQVVVKNLLLEQPEPSHSDLHQGYSCNHNLAISHAMHTILHLPSSEECVRLFMRKLYRTVLLKIFFILQCSQRGCFNLRDSDTEENMLPVKEIRNAVECMRAIFRHRMGDSLVEDIERQGGWDMLMSLETYHTGVAVLTRALQNTGPLCCAAVFEETVVALIVRQEHEIGTMAVFVELLDCVKVATIMERIGSTSILSFLPSYLQSQNSVLRDLATTSLVKLSAIPTMAVILQDLLPEIMQQLQDADSNIGAKAMTVLHNLLRVTDRQKAVPIALQLPKLLLPFFLNESSHVRQLSILLCKDAMEVAGHTRRAEMKKEVRNILLPLFFHMHDQDQSVAQASWEALLCAAKLLKRKHLRYLLKTAQTQRIGECLLMGHGSRADQFLEQSLSYLRSPQEPLQEAAVRFIGLAGQHLRDGREEKLNNAIEALRSLERTGSSSASTLVAETIQLLRTLLGVSPLRYRLSSMWERRLHSLRAGWLRCCSCAQG